MKRVRWILAAMWTGLAVAAFTDSVELGLIGLPIWLLATLITIVLHEAGHAAGAMLAGWRVVVFSVWRLAYHLPNRRIVVLGRDDLHELAGWVLAVPASAGHDTAGRHGVLVAGGPVANLIQAIFAFLCAAGAQPGALILGVEVQPLMLGFAILGIGMFVGNLVPHQEGEFASDGLQLLGLLREEGRRGTSGGETWASAMLGTNVRLRDLPQWMIDDALARCEADPRLARWCATIEIGRTLDRSPLDVVLARSQIDRFRDAHGEGDWLLACDAFLAAVKERDLDRATRMIAQLGDPCELPQMEAAACAAAYQLAGDRQAAGEWLDRMDAIIAARSPFPDLTFRDIRARVENLRPLAGQAPAPLRGLSASA